MSFSDFIGQLPPIAQILVYVMIAVGTLAVGIQAYWRGLNKNEIRPDTDRILTAAGITEMKPIRDLAASVDSLVEQSAKGAHAIAVAVDKNTAALEGIRRLMETEADEAEIERKVQQLLRQERGGPDDPPRPTPRTRRRE